MLERDGARTAVDRKEAVMLLIETAGNVLLGLAITFGVVYIIFAVICWYVARQMERGEL